MLNEASEAKCLWGQKGEEVIRFPRELMNSNTGMWMVSS